jgi:hypothetical protein
MALRQKDTICWDSFASLKKAIQAPAQAKQHDVMRGGSFLSNERSGRTKKTTNITET